jgi:hypothetical protein
LAIHAFFDQSKQLLPDIRHRALLHHTWGIFFVEQLFGATITTSSGRVVPTRFIGEQHVKEDLLRIPTVQDWLECLAPQPWMLRRGKLLDEAPEPAAPPNAECEGCSGAPGVRIDAHPDCHPVAPPGYVVIERCDSCERNEDDLQAARAVADDARWVLRDGRPAYAIGKPKAQEDEVSTGNSEFNDGQKVRLLKELYEIVFDRTESFHAQRIGEDLAYLLGALLNHNICEWPAERPLVVLLREQLGSDHPVWKFICISKPDPAPA